jgi:hypothetical protein
MNVGLLFGNTLENNKEHARWIEMMEACYSKESPLYSINGRIGVYVVDEWHNFYKFLKDVGPMPGDNSYLDRAPGTEFFGPPTTSWRKSKERILIFRGANRTVSEWATYLGIPKATITQRIRNNYQLDKVLYKGTLPRKDITGVRFGMLQVVEFVYTVRTNAFWKCRCDCGSEIKLAAFLLQTNQIKSCGCVPSGQVMLCPKKFRVDGKMRTLAWLSNKYRVPKNTIRTRVRAGLPMDVVLGIEPMPTRFSNTRILSKLTGIAEPTLRHRMELNVDPTTLKSPARVTVGKIYEYDGLSMTLDGWAEYLKENVNSLRARLHAGWTFEEAIKIPVRKRNESKSNI